ncbi:MAG: hypothetical protein D6773_03015 [Alphaproteobacteria bacterium]|nr:MAG: hypothetical protein D6773_03015 [Alphaproteobacteria bacterium]
MSSASATSLYDSSFQHWLERREAPLTRSCSEPAEKSAPVRPKFDLTALLRAQIEPKALARLDALGCAT